ncbi:MAG: PilZ domain-containing protein [Chitinivibrionales bacterium]
MNLINWRKDKRVNITVGISVRIDGAVEHGMSCSNLSAGGMCIRFEGEPPVGDSGRLWLTKQYQDGVITFESEFRRLWVKPVDIGSRDMRMGVRFIDMDAEHRRALNTIIMREESLGEQRGAEHG